MGRNLRDGIVGKVKGNVPRGTLEKAWNCAREVVDSFGQGFVNAEMQGVKLWKKRLLSRTLDVY
jgi:hypothetical protein